MSLSDFEAARLLSTADGRAIVDAVRRAEQVERFRNGRVRDVDAVLRSLSTRIRAATRGRLERTSARGPAALGLRGVVTIEARIVALLREASPRVLEALSPGLRDLALKQGARIGVAGTRALGSTVKQHVAGLFAGILRDARGAVALSVSQGEPVSEAMARLDAVLKRARAQTATVVRTMSDAVAVQARERQIERDGFNLVRYVAILDEATTEICEDLNGTVWRVGEGPRPPQHHGCRSFIAPAESDAEEFSEVSLEQVREAA